MSSAALEAIAALSPEKRGLLEAWLLGGAGTSDRGIAIPNSVRHTIVPIRATGARRPLFCVHPVMGVTFPYYGLAERLDHERPVLGLQAQGLDGNSDPLTSIEAMADVYVAAMKLVQPRGPYSLLGWSFGGWVAFEMARRLEIAGDEVYVVVVDTGAPSSRTSLNALWLFLRTLRGSIVPYLGDYLYLRRSESFTVGSTVRERAWHRVLGLAEHAAVKEILARESHLAMLSQPNVSPLMRVYRANARAAARYSPGRLAGNLTLLRSEQPFTNGHGGANMGWGDLCRAVDVLDVPGNHMGVLRRPAIETVASVLDELLEHKEGTRNTNRTESHSAETRRRGGAEKGRV